MRNILGQVHKDVTGGKSISDAMQAQAAVFGDAYVASVAAGEAAGKLPEVLGRLAQFQRTRDARAGHGSHAAGLSRYC